jgi:hypothetical protein
MNEMEARTLSVIVTVCFVGTWIALGVCGFVAFYLPRDASFKRKWFPRFIILVGVLFVLFSTTLVVLESRSLSELGVLVILVPAVAVISFLNMRFTRFCSKCGATTYDVNWFSPTRFCSKCGAELSSAKPGNLNEL